MTKLNTYNIYIYIYIYIYSFEITCTNTRQATSLFDMGASTQATQQSMETSRTVAPKRKAPAGRAARANDSDDDFGEAESRSEKADGDRAPCVHLRICWRCLDYFSMAFGVASLFLFVEAFITYNSNYYTYTGSIYNRYHLPTLSLANACFDWEDCMQFVHSLRVTTCFFCRSKRVRRTMDDDWELRLKWINSRLGYDFWWIAVSE